MNLSLDRNQRPLNDNEVTRWKLGIYIKYVGHMCCTFSCEFCTVQTVLPVDMHTAADFV